MIETLTKGHSGLTPIRAQRLPVDAKGGAKDRERCDNPGAV